MGAGHLRYELKFKKTDRAGKRAAFVKTRPEQDTVTGRRTLRFGTQAGDDLNEWLKGVAL